MAEKKKRTSPPQDPRLPDLRLRIKALAAKTSVPKFVESTIAAGKKAGIQVPPNQKAGEIGVHRILKGGGGKPWVVDLLEVGVKAGEKAQPTQAEVLDGMRGIGQVPVPEPTPTPAPPTPEPEPVPEPVAANGDIRHVTMEELRELVILAHATAKLEAMHPEDAAALAALVDRRVEQLAAA